MAIESPFRAVRCVGCNREFPFLQITEDRCLPCLGREFRRLERKLKKVRLEERKACANTALHHARREREAYDLCQSAGLRQLAANHVSAIAAAETIAQAITAGGELADRLEEKAAKREALDGN